MPKLNVLVLHTMGNPRYRREAVRTLEYMIPECRPELNCIVHDTNIPFPDYLKDIEYHLIVLGPTFLCNRFHQMSLVEVENSYGFIKHSQACKIALPQDDYDCSGILDNWMVDWKVDRIYTVLPEHISILYPRASHSIEFKKGYTGYISDSWIDFWGDPKPHTQRKIDVSYRATKLSASFGSIGLLKWEIANKFQVAINGVDSLKLDISTDPNDMIPGDAWHSFLEDSKFCLTTASGSSLLDPWSEIRNCVIAYVEKNPTATFQQVERKCFPGLDRQYLFTAISPRNIEAALANTVQIATPGSYSGLMDPIEHFIPLNEDCSNISEVLEMMDNKILVEKIQKRCRESILAEPRLRRDVIVDEIISFTESVVTMRNFIVNDQEIIEKKFNKYYSEIDKITNRFWRQRDINGKIIQTLHSTAVMFGAKRVKDFFRSLL